jgi:predicted aminopeptidase
MPLRILLLCLVLLPSLSGCYLMQAAAGQMQIVARREPIAKVLADPTTPPTLRTRLEYVAAARDFASQQLGLPDNASYRSYADLKRPYVIWNVFATDEFSVDPRRWCFPIAGCVVYRGYFNEATAQRYARRLRLRGVDAIVGPVAAYSTLGYFKDPVLNTMLGWSDASLAGTLFHELAHQVVYVASDSEFNEAFATVVEEAGLKRWLDQQGRASEIDAYHLQRVRGEQFVGLLLTTRERLRQLYRISLPPAQMRERKQQEFGLLKYRYELLKRGDWQGYSGYDRWFDRALNNAHLISAATYYGCIPGFEALLGSLDGDLPRFYEEVRRLSESKAARAELCSKGGSPDVKSSPVSGTSESGGEKQP